MPRFRACLPLRLAARDGQAIETIRLPVLVAATWMTGPIMEMSMRAQETTAVTTRTSGLRRFAGMALLGLATASLAACGGGNERPQADLAASQVTSIGVNSYLWRASLETLAFMPLTQADSAGGVIVTDWYANPESPNERVKVSVSILDSDLRADAVRVAASRQMLQNGTWVEAPVQASTVQRLEDIILTKARDLRRSAIG
jgi:hypothetical protein